MDELSKELGMNIPKGAGDTVDYVGKLIIQKFGEKK